MTDFNTSLLREKFIIRDAMPGTDADRIPVVAVSNRISLPLVSDNGQLSETFIVRAQNMHTCARLAAQIARDFQEDGPIMARQKPYDWQVPWLTITKGYEKKWNPARWAAIYHKGRLVFEANGEEGKRHPFLDIIEQCDARNKDDYEKAVEVARDAFKQAGRNVNIEHDSNIALVMSATDDEGKCGVIVRGPSRTTTFNFTAKKKAGRIVRPSQILSVAAGFLEGIQLTFLVGMTKQKVKYELITPASPEAQKGDDASHKLGRLNGAVAQFENLLEVVYRPDKPNFSAMVDEAEGFARKILAAEIEKKIASGESGDWVS